MGTLQDQPVFFSEALAEKVLDKPVARMLYLTFVFLGGIIYF